MHNIICIISICVMISIYIMHCILCYLSATARYEKQTKHVSKFPGTEEHKMKAN
jgi:hypothetical protein